MDILKINKCVILKYLQKKSEYFASFKKFTENLIDILIY